MGASPTRVRTHTAPSRPTATIQPRYELLQLLPVLQALPQVDRPHAPRGDRGRQTRSEAPLHEMRRGDRAAAQRAASRLCLIDGQSLCGIGGPSGDHWWRRSSSVRRREPVVLSAAYVCAPHVAVRIKQPLPPGRKQGNARHPFLHGSTRLLIVGGVDRSTAQVSPAFS